jgi:hypothetical protein
MCLCAAANTALLQAAGQALNAEVAELKHVISYLCNRSALVSESNAML